MRFRIPAPNKQKGHSLLIALIVMAIAGVVSIVTVSLVQRETKSAGQFVAVTRAEYVAESALNWAINAVGPGYQFATHDTTGETVAATGTNPCGETGKRIESDSLAKVFPPVYKDESVTYDADNWVYHHTSDASKSLSGHGDESMAVKVWYNGAGDTVKIRAKGRIGGEESEIFMAGSIVSFTDFMIVSNGDLTPIHRRTDTLFGNVHTNGDLYLQPGNDDIWHFETERLSASGSVKRVSQYKTMADAKISFITDGSNQSADWDKLGLFPVASYSFPIRPWDADKSVYINGTEYTSSDALPSEVVPNAPVMPIPDFTPPSDYTTSQGPDDCGCDVKSVKWYNLATYPPTEFIFNPQYGAYRMKDSLYCGYHARSSTMKDGYYYNSDATNFQQGNIIYGWYREKGDYTVRSAGWGIIDKTLETYINHSNSYHTPGDWADSWVGGNYGGEWVKAWWYDLSDPDSYPRKCASGGVVDFEDENVIVVNGDSLHYPISIYTTGEIYLIGDFNVGWNAVGTGVPWTPEDESGVRVLHDQDKGAVKGAAVIADGNRIWYLSHAWADSVGGFGSRTGTRNGYRGRKGMFKINRTGPKAVFAGCFVTGAPNVDQAWFTMSSAHASLEPRAPYSFDEVWGSGTARRFELIGSQVFKCNGVLESDWDPVGDTFSVDYWTELDTCDDSLVVENGISLRRDSLYEAHFGDGWPPRPGRIAPRYARGYRSFHFQNLHRSLPEPPGAGRTLVSKGIYKR